MVTEEQILDKGFCKFIESKQSASNSIDERVDYIALGAFKSRKQYLLLSYFDNGLMKITDYFENPLTYREYYFTGQVTTQEQLDKVISKLKYDICDLDCNEICISKKNW